MEPNNDKPINGYLNLANMNLCFFEIITKFEQYSPIINILMKLVNPIQLSNDNNYAKTGVFEENLETF